MKEDKQYYKTLHLNENARQIAIVELEDSLEIARSQNKLYGQLANVIFGLISIFLAFLLNKDFNILTFQKNIVIEIRVIIFILYSFLLYMLLMYFISLQKSLVHNSRKVVILRKVLGLDYKPLPSSLPAWRIEGATNPYAIKFFTNWFSIIVYPLYIVLISLFVLSYILIYDFKFFYKTYIIHFNYIIPIIISSLFIFKFRNNLNDEHESWYLHCIKILSKFLNIKIKSDINYILYRAKLAIQEVNRLKYKLDNIKKILVDLEDKKFYKHNGIDYKALIRAVLSKSSYFRKKYKWANSGGSTLTMQLARTLFIVDYNKIIRRKILECFLSKWLEKQFSKEQIILMYLVSVQFHKKIHGIENAINFFYNENIKFISDSQAFVLIERLSNITNKIKVLKIKNQFENLTEIKNKEKLFSEIKKVYDELHRENKLIKSNK